MRNLPVDVFHGPRGAWGPIVDGSLLSRSVHVAFSAGDQAKVPLITGFTTEEGSPYPLTELHTQSGLRDFSDAQFGGDAQEFIELYPARDDADARAHSYRIRRDGSFAYQAWIWASLHAETSSGMRSIRSTQNVFRGPLPITLWRNP
jgi:para-nitrobenzyl esterase